MSAPVAPENVDAVFAAVEAPVEGVHADVKPTVESVDRELAMRREGRAWADRTIRISGAEFRMSQAAVDLALEAFEKTDVGNAYREDERELDGESVTATEAWVTGARRSLELAAKLDGDIDFGSERLRVDQPKESAGWRIAYFKVSMLHTLSRLCFEDWVESEYADASIVLDLLFAPAIAGSYGPLPRSDSPLIDEASIGLFRHAALTGGKVGTKASTMEGMAEHLIAKGVDPFIAEALLDGWQGMHDIQYQGIHAVHLTLVKIANGLTGKGRGA